MRSNLKVKPVQLTEYRITVKGKDGLPYTYFMMFQNPCDAVMDALERHGICKIKVMPA